MASKQSAVNWRIVDDELANVPQDFKDAKFYALKHVVEILTSSNPQAMVAQLRDQEQRLVALVDQMVQGYHSGFAKSIQNYSQILQLFGDAKEQVDGLKKALADAGRQLNTQSRTLQQQWRKSLTLECSLGLLDDIQMIADAPGKIDEALAAKDWSSAVRLLLQACSKLAMEELTKVGALKKLRQDMLAICLAIQIQLLDELHSKVYASSSLGQAVQPGQNGRYNSRQYNGQYNSSSTLGTATPARSETPPRGEDSPKAARAAKGSVLDELRAQQRKTLSRSSPVPGTIAASIMPAFVQEALQGSITLQQQRQQQQYAAARAANVAELVTCLHKLGALEEAKTYLLLHARAGVRRMVLEVVEAWATAQEDTQQQLLQQQGLRSSSGGSGWASKAFMQQTFIAGGTTGAKQDWAVPPAAQLAAKKLLQAVFDSCLRALSNLGILLHEIAEATNSSSSSSTVGGKQGSAIKSSRLKQETSGAAAAAAAVGGKPQGGLDLPSAAGLQQLKQQLLQRQQQERVGAGSSSSSGFGTSGSSSNLVGAAAAAGLQSIPSEVLPGSSAGFIGGKGLGGLDNTINPLNPSVFGSSGNLLALGGSLGSSTAAVHSAGISHPGQGLEWLRSGGFDGKDATEYIRAQYGHVWNEIQEECVLLLAELLRAALRSAAYDAAAAAAKGAKQGGWLSEFTELREKAKGQLQVLQATGSTALSTFGSSTLTAAAATAAGSTGGTAAASPGSTGSTNPTTGSTASPQNPSLARSSQPLAGINNTGGSKLSFGFEVTADILNPAFGVGSGGRAAAAAAGGGSGGGGSAAAAAGGVLAVGSSKESLSYAALLRKGLGEHVGGPYLTPAVYLAVSNFVSDALIVIADAASVALSTHTGSSSSSRPAQDGSSSSSIRPSSFALQQQQHDIQQSVLLSDPRLNSGWLRQSVEEYVLEGFLPKVWVDLRGRCTAALDDPDAFRPPVNSGVQGFNITSSSRVQNNSAAAAAAAAVAGGNASVAAAAAGGGRLPAPPPRAVVSAAAFAVQVLQEVMDWLPAMPANAAVTLTGVIEAILGRVLEAMAAQAANCLAGAKAGRLAVHPHMALIMATEPDAVQLSSEDPVAFYVPLAAAGNSDVGESGFNCWGDAGGFECSGFQTLLKAADKPNLVPGFYRPPSEVRGLGLEGESAAEEVLLYTLRERPAAAHQLLVCGKPAALVQLAALTESCDWVADCLGIMADAAAGGNLTAGSWLSSRKTPTGKKAPTSPTKGAKAGSHKSAAAAAGDAAAAAVSNSLQQLADRYRSFAGACCRALRLDLLLMAARQLHVLSTVSHLCEEEDVLEAHPSIAGVSRLAARAVEELSPLLSATKMNYVFGAIAGAAARFLMWVLEDISEMNAMGVERMVRSLALLQSHLCGPGAPGAATPAGGAAEVSRAYDKAKQFYTLVGLPVDEVIRLAADRPGRFSVAEWESLLLVQVPGRAADEQHLQALHRALNKHYHLSTGQKVADFFEDVRETIQAPVAHAAGSVSAGLKGGFSQAKSIIGKAAGSMSKK